MEKILPQHIAIIMDGNGRWASAKGWPRILGHREGARNVRRITIHCSEIGIKVLTLYAFSAENWARPRREVELLMRLLKLFAIRERKLFVKYNVRLRVIGDMDRLPLFAQEALKETMEFTSKHTGMVLQLALSYSSRNEIIRAAQKLAARVESGELKSSDINEELFANELDTAGQPDPDLLIRTSGEKRISNYLLWQSAYSELYFTDKLWPEFDIHELEIALEEFSKRDRRFGKLSTLSSSASTLN